MVRVVVVDDYPAVRQVVRTLLQSNPEIDVVGVAANSHEALRLAQELHPDVVVTDVLMPGGGGIDLMRGLQNMANRPAVVMFSINDTTGAIERAYASGASAFVPKKKAHAELVQAVLNAAAAQVPT